MEKERETHEWVERTYVSVASACIGIGVKLMIVLEVETLSIVDLFARKKRTPQTLFSHGSLRKRTD